MNLYPQIDTIMNKFDFKKVRDVMMLLGWTWAPIGGKVPNLEQLRSCAFENLNIVCNEYYKLSDEEKKYGFTVSTGGFTARVEYREDAPPILSLIFYVDEQVGIYN